MFEQTLRQLDLLHIFCNTGTLALPDKSAFTLGCCAYISGNVLVHMLQLLHVFIATSPLVMTPYSLFPYYVIMYVCS